MRMWMVTPKYMCNKHLLGEHVEIHMLVGSLLKNKSIKGFIENELLEPQNIYVRHNELITEMQKRGMNHKSVLPFVEVTKNNFGHVDKDMSMYDLITRCPACAKNYFTKREEQN